MPGISIGTQIGGVRKPSTTALPTPANNLVVGVGDSITVASGLTAGQGITPKRGFTMRTLSNSVGSYMAWAAMLPKTGDAFGNGRFRYNGVHATSGLAVSDILATHINGTDSPLNDNPKPGIVVVMAGTNDIGAIKGGTRTQAAVIADLRTIHTTLHAAGILTVACAVPPTNTSSDDATIRSYNTAVSAMASSLGIIFVDMHTPTVNVNVWQTGYNFDNAHPSMLGAKVMGQTLRDAIDSILYSGTPALVTSGADTASDLVYKGGANNTQSSTTGVPTGGPTPGNYYTWTASGATPTLGARTNYSGQAWRINKSTDSGQTTATGSGASVLTLVDGRSYELGCILEVGSWSGTNTYLDLSMVKVTDGTKVPVRVQLLLDSTFTGAIAPFKWLRTFQCSDSETGTPIPSGAYRLNWTVGHSTGTPTDNLMDLYIGQITLRDLGVI